MYVGLPRAFTLSQAANRAANTPRESWELDPELLNNASKDNSGVMTCTRKVAEGLNKREVGEGGST